MSNYADGEYGDGSFGNALTVATPTYSTGSYGGGDYGNLSAVIETPTPTCQKGYINIVTSDWPFDPQDEELAYPGTWYQFGSQDALNGLVARTLSAPFNVFQCYYDEGFQHGAWNRQFLARTSM